MKWKKWRWQKWYFVSRIVLTYCEKKMFYWSRKFFEIWGWRPRIYKFFEFTRTVYLNSERSDKFLKTELIFNLFLEAFRSNTLEELLFKLEKKLGFRNLQVVWCHEQDIELWVTIFFWFDQRVTKSLMLLP